MNYRLSEAIKTERGPIAEDFERMHNDRSESLDMVDQCAVLAGKPWLASSRWWGTERNRRLYTPYQSTVTHALNHLTGVTGIAFFNPGGIWQRAVVKPQVRFDPDINPKALIDIENELRLREFTLQSLLESAGSVARNYAGKIRRPSYSTTFFGGRIAAIDRIFAIGETLEFIDDDFRLRNVPRENYVTDRDGGQEVMLHIVKECIDPLALSPAQFRKSGIRKEDINGKRGHERQVEMYTLVEWSPRSGRWVVTQEVNANVINEYADPISPYMCSGLEIGARDDYHHGLVEMYLADVKSANELAKRLLDGAGMCAKMVPVIDYGAEVSEEDLARDSGVPLRARVEGGAVMDLAFLHTQKTPDLSFAEQYRQGMEARIAKAMLAASDAVRKSERTTAYEIQSTVLAELQGVHGGILARMQPGLHVQLIHRVDWQAKKQGLIRPLVKNENKLIDYDFLTGPAALSREGEYQKLKEFAIDIGVVAQAFPEVMGRVDPSVLIQRMAAMKEFYTGGLILDDKAYAAKQAEQLKMLAAQQAIQSAGTIAEGAAAAGAQAQTAP